MVPRASTSAPLEIHARDIMHTAHQTLTEDIGFADADMDLLRITVPNSVKTHAILNRAIKMHTATATDLMIDAARVILVLLGTDLNAFAHPSAWDLEQVGRHFTT
uniref:Uncharacterized protein n=1 Tax=Ciona intestinalis TaxID=7719 RepID=F7ANC2_CIOIN